MSKDIIVLAPNGRRQKVTCTPDTIILKVLEDVCEKQGFQPLEYDLKHHNHILDLTTTVRFSNLPNKATVEMVETERKREEKNVTIGLLLEDGDRRTADFPPNTCLFDLITSLAPNELNSLQHPMIIYMRQEVAGLSALKERTLRQLGLLGGRAILRLLNKENEARQANVSSVYRRPVPEKPNDEKEKKQAGNFQNNQLLHKSDSAPVPGPSNTQKKTFDPNKLLKDVNTSKDVQEKLKINERNENQESYLIQETPMETDEIKQSPSSTSLVTQENLERRLKIEEEVTFLGAQKAVAFMQPDQSEEEIHDLPDDFYELTIEEVRKLYHELQHNRMDLMDSPLLTASKKDLNKQTSTQKLAGYKNVVVRVQFPDRIILQGIFLPTNTIQNVTDFIKEHLQDPNRPFHISRPSAEMSGVFPPVLPANCICLLKRYFLLVQSLQSLVISEEQTTITSPLKESLDANMTLLEAKFVPCVHIHFKWFEDGGCQSYLKEEIYLKQTSSDAAGILASKYRAPSRRKIDSSDSSQANTSKPAKTSKLPNWFKK